MMAAPVGAIVKLYVDFRHQLDAGHIVLTQSGCRYLVLSTRVQERGKRGGIRQRCTAIVLAVDKQTPEGSPVLESRWYRR